jgi:hypothetical protein
MSRNSTPRPVAALKSDALRAATDALVEALEVQINRQHSYLHIFPDGKVSIEGEWVDARKLARAAITSYLEATSGGTAASRKRSK